MIHTFKSETGYIRNKITKVVYIGHTIYLGIYDTADNYEEATEADYDAYEAAEKKRMEEELNANRQRTR